MKDEHRTEGDFGGLSRAELISELAELRQRVAELEAADTERRRAEERVDHLNAVLRAIRSVNQLITREKDRGRLLRGACERFIEVGGYYSAWIALLDESRELVTTAEAGLGEALLPLAEQLERGELTACGRSALSQSGVVVTEDPPSACADCPLAANYAGRGAMTVRLEHGDKVYGLLSVSIPTHILADQEEQALLREVAADIAFALHNIELEKERGRVEEALQASEERFALAVRGSDAGLWDWDIQNNSLYWSPRLKELLGYADDELDVDFETFESLLYPDDREHTRAAIEAHLKDRGLYEVEQRLRTKSGEYRWFRARGQALWDEAGNPVRMIGFTTDITERKRAEEALQEYSERLEEMVEERTKELREAQEELVRKEKLAVLGQLAGGVGHELRNPLGVISNAVYFLQLTLPDADETTKEYLEIIAEEVRNSAKIVSDLLDFSRTRLPEREKVAVSELVAQVLEKHPSPEGVEVTTEIAPDLPPVFVDPRQIGLVLANLVVNAYQAMPKGGMLTIKTSEVSEKLPKSEVALSVADTGSGISEENMAKLFEPLFTTKARGIGLGLAVSKTLVEANGGSIQVKSVEGQGSTFTVRLPISRE